jgi:hypothetical protein
MDLLMRLLTEDNEIVVIGLTMNRSDEIQHVSRSFTNGIACDGDDGQPVAAMHPVYQALGEFELIPDRVRGDAL